MAHRPYSLPNPPSHSIHSLLNFAAAFAVVTQHENHLPPTIYATHQLFKNTFADFHAYFSNVRILYLLLQFVGANLASEMKEMKENNSDLASELMEIKESNSYIQSLVGRHWQRPISLRSSL